jgi:hypothetical protein
LLHKRLVGKDYIMAFLSILLLLFSFLVIPEKTETRFEGSMTFVKQTYYDTTYYAYHVKGNYIRIEEMNRSRVISRIYIADIHNKAMVALHPARKLFTTIRVNPYLYAVNPDSEVIKTENRRRIKGIICAQWRVKNIKENTEITFWVANEQFYFYKGLLEIVNGIDKINFYFMQIPGADGFMPLLTEERNLLREKRTHIELIEFEKKQLDPKLFIIPDDYKLFVQ